MLTKAGFLLGEGAFHTKFSIYSSQISDIPEKDHFAFLITLPFMMSRIVSRWVHHVAARRSPRVLIPAAEVLFPWLLEFESRDGALHVNPSLMSVISLGSPCNSEAEPLGLDP